MNAHGRLALDRASSTSCVRRRDVLPQARPDLPLTGRWHRFPAGRLPSLLGLPGRDRMRITRASGGALLGLEGPDRLIGGPGPDRLDGGTLG